MIEADAYELALEYMRANGVTHFGLKHKASWCNHDAHLGLHSTGFPKGIRRKLWYFAFALEEPPSPNVIVSGGDYVVLVDDETGTCGHFVSL